MQADVYLLHIMDTRIGANWGEWDANEDEAAHFYLPIFGKFRAVWAKQVYTGKRGWIRVALVLPLH